MTEEDFAPHTAEVEPGEYEEGAGAVEEKIVSITPEKGPEDIGVTVDIDEPTEEPEPEEKPKATKKKKGGRKKKKKS